MLFFSESVTCIFCSFWHNSGLYLLGTMFGNPFFHFKWWCQLKLNTWDVFGMYLKQFWSDQSFEICSWHLWRHNCCIDLLGTHMDKSCLDKSHVMIYFSLDFFSFCSIVIQYKLEQIAIERSASKSWSWFSSISASAHQQHQCIRA